VQALGDQLVLRAVDLLADLERLAQRLELALGVAHVAEQVAEVVERAGDLVAARPGGLPHHLERVLEELACLGIPPPVARQQTQPAVDPAEHRQRPVEAALQDLARPLVAPRLDVGIALDRRRRELGERHPGMIRPQLPLHQLDAPLEARGGLEVVAPLEGDEAVAAEHRDPQRHRAIGGEPGERFALEPAVDPLRLVPSALLAAQLGQREPGVRRSSRRDLRIGAPGDRPLDRPRCLGPPAGDQQQSPQPRRRPARPVLVAPADVRRELGRQTRPFDRGRLAFEHAQRRLGGEAEPAAALQRVLRALGERRRQVARRRPVASREQAGRVARRLGDGRGARAQQHQTQREKTGEAARRTRRAERGHPRILAGPWWSPLPSELRECDGVIPRPR
jgi:hypothetical protein